MSLLKQDVTYFDGSKGNLETIPEGKYFAHIESINKKLIDKTVPSRSVQGATHLCDLLEIIYKIAGDSESAGRKVWSNAIWIFKDPEDGEHTPNPGGNYRYSQFLSTVDYPCKEVEVEDDKGEKRTVKELPIELDSSYVLGKPVIIEVKHRNYTNKEGEEKVAANESGIYPWPEGKSIEVDDNDDLPF